MIARIRQKGFYGLAAFVALAVVMNQFLAVYRFNDRETAIYLVGIICFIFVALPRFWLRGPFALLALLVAGYQYFPLGQSFGLDWLVALQRQLRPLIFAVQQDDLGRTPSLLAFSLIFSGVALLALLIINYEHFLVSYSGLLLYLAMLAVFNHLDLVWQLLLVCGCGLLSSGLKQHRQRGGQANFSYLLAAAIFLGVLGFAADKVPDALVRDRLSAQTVAVRDYFNAAGLYSYIERVGAGGNSRTGFSEDDEALGGALLDDETVLFEAQQLRPHYWRVDSKDFYTGKGWQRTTASEGQVIMESQFTLDAEAVGVPFLEVQHIDLTFHQEENYLPLPYGYNQVYLAAGFAGFVYAPDQRRVDLLARGGGEPSVEIASLEPIYDVASLQKVPLTNPSTDTIDYLQLPANFPTRIRELAGRVTAEATTLYDQVTAVESYLSQSEAFRYSKVDAVAPLPDQDYVDQFLFETKVGYCDNFSTAMVTMLRSLGISARWAKGFSQGTAIPSFDERKTYEIKNLNAHSWPEVYFEGFGWVPFEPTPSFSNPQRPGNAEAATEESVAAGAADTSTESSSSESQATSETTSQSTSESTLTSDTAGKADPNGKSRIGTWKLWQVAMLFALALVIVAGGTCLWYFQIKLGLWLRLHLYRRPYEQGYLFLLKEAEKWLPRQSSEDLTSYSEKLAKAYPETAAFSQLTKTYEEHLYQGRELGAASRELLWLVADQLTALKKTQR